MLEIAICLNEKICSCSMAGSSDGTRVLLSTDGIWFWSTDRMTGVLSTSSSSRSGGPLNTPIINVSSCSINLCCCLLIWCKYLTVSVDDAMQESMEQLEKSLNSPCGLHEVWWSGENPWTVTVTGMAKTFMKNDEAESMLEPVIVTGSAKTSVHFIFPNKYLQCFWMIIFSQKLHQVNGLLNVMIKSYPNER